MRIREIFHKFIRRNIYSPEWKCLICGREIFNGSIFCDDCEKQLPLNNGYICSHCGRQTGLATEYCTTCKEVMLSIDRARSLFVYDGEIPRLIMGLKYSNKRFLVDYFAKKLSFLYFQNYFNADYITFIPMTKKAEAKRGYNQSKLLAKAVCVTTNLTLLECVEKVRETKRQAKLGRKDRLKNLEKAFRCANKKLVKDKTIVIIDDVLTTGATTETVARLLKECGASKIFVLTLASTIPFDKY